MCCAKDEKAVEEEGEGEQEGVEGVKDRVEKEEEVVEEEVVEEQQEEKGERGVEYWNTQCSVAICRKTLCLVSSFTCRALTPHKQLPFPPRSVFAFSVAILVGVELSAVLGFFFLLSFFSSFSASSSTFFSFSFFNFEAFSNFTFVIGNVDGLASSSTHAVKEFVGHAAGSWKMGGVRDGEANDRWRGSGAPLTPPAITELTRR